METLREVTRRINTFETPLLVRTLDGLQTLFNVLEPDELVEAIARKWFDVLGEVPMDFVMKYARNPFGEIRLAGLGVMLSISKQKWGQDFIKNTPGTRPILSTFSIKNCFFVF